MEHSTLIPEPIIQTHVIETKRSTFLGMPSNPNYPFIEQIAVSDDNQLFAAVDDKGKLFAGRFDDGKIVSCSFNAPDKKTGLVFEPGSHMIVMAARKNVYFYDVYSGGLAKTRTATFERNIVYLYAWKAQQMIFVVLENGEIHYVKMGGERLTKFKKYPFDEHGSESLIGSPDGRWLGIINQRLSRLTILRCETHKKHPFSSTEHLLERTFTEDNTLFTASKQGGNWSKPKKYIWQVENILMFETEVLDCRYVSDDLIIFVNGNHELCIAQIMNKQERNVEFRVLQTYHLNTEVPPPITLSPDKRFLLVGAKVAKQWYGRTRIPVLTILDFHKPNFGFSIQTKLESLFAC